MAQLVTDPSLGEENSVTHPLLSSLMPASVNLLFQDLAAHSRFATSTSRIPLSRFLGWTPVASTLEESGPLFREEFEGSSEFAETIFVGSSRVNNQLSSDDSLLTKRTQEEPENEIHSLLLAGFR